MPTDSLTAHAEFAECSNMVCGPFCPYLYPLFYFLCCVYFFRGNVTDPPVYVNAVVGLKGQLVISVSAVPLS